MIRNMKRGTKRFGIHRKKNWHINKRPLHLGTTKLAYYKCTYHSLSNDIYLDATTPSKSGVATFNSKKKHNTK